ncbi:MAG: HIT family protein [Xenococcaceae cyanobacterium]
MFVNNCPFCQIAKSNTAILEHREHSIAFLDISPIRPGHVLITPKEHKPDFFELSNDVLTEIMYLAKMIANAQKVVFQPVKVGMLVVGFDVLHAHLHLIPMHDYHDITSKQLLEGKAFRAESAELEKNKRQLKDALYHIS